MIKRNLFFTLLLSVSQFVFPLITFPYSSRILGPAGIGTVNFVDSFTQYFLLIAALGIPTYGVREVAKLRSDQQALNKIFSEVFVIHLLSTLILSGVYVALAYILPDVHVHLQLVFIGVLLMICSVFTVEWFYSGIEQFSYITYRTLVVRTISIVALFMLLRPGSSPSIYYLLMVLAVVLTGIVNMVNLKNYAHISLKQLQLSRHLKPLFILLSSALAVSVYVLIDNIILGFMKGEAAVGIYSTATKIVKLPFALLLAVNAVIIPKVSLAYSEGRLGDIQELINKSFAFLCVVGLPVTVGICVSARFLVHTFAGDKFLNAVPVLQILSPVTMIVGFTFIFAAQLLTPMGKEKQLVKISLAGMIFSVVLNLFLIPWLSYSGAAITNVLTEIAVAGLCYQLTKKYIKIQFDHKIFTVCLLCSLAFIPISILIRNMIIRPLYADLMVIISCALVYVACLWVFVKNRYLEDLKNDLLAKFGFVMNKSVTQ